MERFSALLTGIIAELKMQNKAVCEHRDLLFDIGEPQGNKDDTQCTVPQGPHLTAYYE